MIAQFFSFYNNQNNFQKRAILMGLDYLNKKIWHPGSMKNIQKVWQVQQIQREINKKGRQRAKKLLEEQHNDQLKRIQVQAGLIPRSHLDRMDWMYDWGNKINQQKTNQEFLTGQKTANEKDKEFKHICQEAITNRKCEDFQLLFEDPMYEIKKQEKARRDALMNNPIDMKNIIKEVERQYLPKDFQERKKKYYSSIRRRSPSSEERKHRKHKKRSQRERSQSSSSSSRSRSRQRQRQKKSEDVKPEKKLFKQSKIYQQYLKDRFGSIIKKDQEGHLKPDYSMHKTKYKTQYQLDEEERRKRLDKLRENAKRLQDLREKGQNYEEEKHSPNERDYELGAANIRKSMMGGVKENRNHKKYRRQDSQ